LIWRGIHGQDDARQDDPYHGADFDDSKPVLDFAITPNPEVIEEETGDGDDKNPNFSGSVRQPKRDCGGRCDELCREGHNLRKPVRPPTRKPLIVRMNFLDHIPMTGSSNDWRG
jgi:hypothetical protein